MATETVAQNQSDECLDVKCTICLRNNRAKQVQKYCIECKKNLCRDCVEIHIEHIGGHTLVDGRGEEAEVNLLTERCEKHKDKLIKFICVDHDVLVCSTCALLEHRKCDELKQITDFIDDLNKDRKVHEVPGQLKIALQNVDQVLISLEQHIEELSQRERNFLVEIEEYTKRLLAKIETLRQNARQAASIKQEQAASDATETRTVCVTAKTNIIKCMDDMTSAGNRKSHLFILKKKGESMTKDVETLCKESENMMKRVNFQFKPDWRIEDTLNEFNSLITEREKYKVSLKMDIDASVEDDTIPCDIEGCCLLPDGTVLLVDNNNNRVKHMNTSDYTIKDHCDIDGDLRGITCINPLEFAISTGSTSVPVVSLGNKMTRTSIKQLNHDCDKIAQSNGEMFTTESNCVNVYNLTGTLLRTICQNESGDNMFTDIKGITLNQTGDRIYVADWDNGLICTDRAGQEVFTLSEEELGLCVAQGGVCTDQRGNVLLSGYSSHNVVQVTKDGRVIGEILSEADGIEHPQCMCFDADRRRLYVGGNTSKLMMYQLI